MKCRNCKAELKSQFIDLGSAPLSNAYLSDQALQMPEKWFPLKIMVCAKCWLVQTMDYAGASEIFSSDYAYFSSFSTSWLKHAENYVEAVTKRFGLDSSAHVVEIAANDGYLLQYFKRSGIPCLGVEPTSSTADAARKKGINIIEEFFGVSLAKKLSANGKLADLMVANNVLAHVPDINDFVRGFALLLKPHGVATFEFPHLMRLVEENQFDTIYHEHFSYLSLTALTGIFEKNGLMIFDVEELTTHGGSLRLYVQNMKTGRHKTNTGVSMVMKKERSVGMNKLKYYSDFQAKADKVKNEFLGFLIKAKQKGETVAAYGAAAKGNTLLNYAGVRTDLMSWVVDRNPAKQGKYLPGSRIPIVDESCLKKEQPDYIVILPWNLKKEVTEQLVYAREWGSKFITAIPCLTIS